MTDADPAAGLRGLLGSVMLMIARSDALAVEGLDAALDRPEADLEAGVDALFIERPTGMDELQAIPARFARRVPLIHNLAEGGQSPADDGAVLASLGFAGALHPLLLMHGLAAAPPNWVTHRRDRRTTRGLPLADLAAMNRLTGAADLIDWGERHGG